MQDFNEDQKARITKTKEAIDAILDQYNTALVPQLTILAGQVNHAVVIVPQKEESRIVVPNLSEAKLPTKGANHAA